MKILIVGSDKVFAIENFYVKYLKSAGNEVVHFPAQTMFYDYYLRSHLNKLLFRSGLSFIYDNINLKLKALIQREKPDVIWIFKGMEIYPATLKWAKEKKYKLVSFNGDNPFLFSGKGSGNKNVTRCIDLYDLHFTYNRSIDKEFRKRNLKSAILPFGFDVNQDFFDKCETEKEILRICFLGNPDKERAIFIERLAANNLPISLYGNSWEKFIKNPTIEIHPPIYGEELWRVLRRYRVQLNLMRKHNPDSHNMRTFEVPAIGGIMLAPDTLEHRSFFSNGKEFFLFMDVSDCSLIANKLLSLSSQEANLIRLAARKRSVESGYSYRERADEALGLIRDLVL